MNVAACSLLRPYHFCFNHFSFSTTPLPWNLFFLSLLCSPKYFSFFRKFSISRCGKERSRLLFRWYSGDQFRPSGWRFVYSPRDQIIVGLKILKGVIDCRLVLRRNSWNVTRTSGSSRRKGEGGGCFFYLTKKSCLSFSIKTFKVVCLYTVKRES